MDDDDDFFEATREKKKTTTTTKKKKRALERRLCAYILSSSPRDTQYKRVSSAHLYMIWGIGNAFSNASFLFPR